MCRNIHTLYNVDPPANQAELHEAALQFVRKVSGYRQPSKVNEQAFDQAVDEIEASLDRLLSRLSTKAPHRPRIKRADHPRDFSFVEHP